LKRVCVSFGFFQVRREVLDQARDRHLVDLGDDILGRRRRRHQQQRQRPGNGTKAETTHGATSVGKGKAGFESTITP